MTQTTPSSTRPPSHCRPSCGEEGGLSGNISFAAATYRVGNPFRRRQVEVKVVGDTVEISQDGRLLGIGAGGAHGDPDGGGG